MNGIHFSGGGGRFSTADRLRAVRAAALNRGDPMASDPSRAVELMGSMFAPDTLPGRPKREATA